MKDLSTKESRAARMEELCREVTDQFSRVFGNRLAELTLMSYEAGMEQVKHEDPDIRNATLEDLLVGYYAHLRTYHWCNLMEDPVQTTRAIADLLLAYHVAGTKHDTEEEA